MIGGFIDTIDAETYVFTTPCGDTYYAWEDDQSKKSHIGMFLTS